MRTAAIVTIISALAGAGATLLSPVSAQPFAQSAPATPRGADGKPDLAGYWASGPGPVSPGAGATKTGVLRVLLAQTRGDSSENFETDNSVRSRSSDNRPFYKPQFWPKVRELDFIGNDKDPSFRCMPDGVPRMGAPQRIVRSGAEFIFLYESADTYRVVPITAKHNEERLGDETWRGDSIASWDGETLVVDTIGFNDASWLSTAGFIHSNKMHVVERFTRVGDSLSYQVTIDDPEMFLRPWRKDPITLRANKDPAATLFEEPPCDERDQEHIVDPLTHH